ncbi:MAG TPA: hypothetical protein VKY36_02215 [Moheibacter sp.]|nr:hypothetical protein [Moheibacter sp.]
MKKISLRLFFLFNSVLLFAQVGINTDSPQSSLDIQGDLSLRKELRLNGTAATLGDPGQSGQVLFSQDGSNLPMWKFIEVPFLEQGQIQLKYSYAVSDEVGIEFPTGSGDGVDVSALGDPLNSSWKEIPGLQTTVEAGNSLNKINILFQSGVEMPNTYSSESSSSNYVRFACGIFMNDTLVALRGDQINGVNNKNAKNQGIYTLSYILSDIPEGTYTLKVACRKTRTSPGGNYPLAIGKALSTGTQVANNFMLSSSLKVDVMEYISND